MLTLCTPVGPSAAFRLRAPPVSRRAEAAQPWEVTAPSPKPRRLFGRKAEPGAGPLTALHGPPGLRGLQPCACSPRAERLLLCQPSLWSEGAERSGQGVQAFAFENGTAICKQRMLYSLWVCSGRGSWERRPVLSLGTRGTWPPTQEPAPGTSLGLEGAGIQGHVPLPAMAQHLTAVTCRGRCHTRSRDGWTLRAGGPCGTAVPGPAAGKAPCSCWGCSETPDVGWAARPSNPLVP